VSQEHSRPVSEGLGLGLEAKVLARDEDQDQDLLQWQGYGNLHTRNYLITYRSPTGPYVHIKYYYVSPISRLLSTLSFVTLIAYN